MHQLPERRIVFNLGVYIQDMRFVPKQCAGFSDRSINVIDRVAIAQHIMLRDEDDISCLYYNMEIPAVQAAFFELFSTTC